jgi:hypothetical protein
MAVSIGTDHNINVKLKSVNGCFNKYRLSESVKVIGSIFVIHFLAPKILKLFGFQIFWL